jgi:hypothetical protein
MTKLFENGDFKEYKIACSKKKSILILCKTDKTSFGLLIVDPIIFGQLNSSSLICAFNIAQRKEFKGKGGVWGWDGGDWGRLVIDGGDVVIGVDGKGDYWAKSKSDGEILKIT